uniref:Helicase-associated domain-containing protein n=1 Tax=Corethron hystrix TaxID=216773 RepID=A0A7S1FUJ4_9STRA|mmetsp:Transcript_29073/g.66616  ORF Transcript_29073/g.66616 Transcript_29073/m.66616 type:complete len:838 (+) Transcript_29073:70-2583(+)
MTTINQIASQPTHRRYYAVRKGRAVRSCIFLFWNDCKAHVDGHDDAEYCDFDDIIAAVEYAEQSAVPPPFFSTPLVMSLASTNINLKDNVLKLGQKPSYSDAKNCENADEKQNPKKVATKSCKQIKRPVTKASSCSELESLGRKENLTDSTHNREKNCNGSLEKSNDTAQKNNCEDFSNTFERKAVEKKRKSTKDFYSAESSNMSGNLVLMKKQKTTGYASFPFNQTINGLRMTDAFAGLPWSSLQVQDKSNTLQLGTTFMHTNASAPTVLPLKGAYAYTPTTNQMSHIHVTNLPKFRRHNKNSNEKIDDGNSVGNNYNEEKSGKDRNDGASLKCYSSASQPMTQPTTLFNMPNIPPLHRHQHFDEKNYEQKVENIQQQNAESNAGEKSIQEKKGNSLPGISCCSTSNQLAHANEESPEKPQLCGQHSYGSVETRNETKTEDNFNNAYSGIKLDKNWVQKYEELKMYYRKHEEAVRHNMPIPQKPPSLDRFISIQKQKYKVVCCSSSTNSSLDLKRQKKIDLLRQINFDFFSGEGDKAFSFISDQKNDTSEIITIEKNWMEKYGELKSYNLECEKAARDGTLAPPKPPALDRFIRVQRQLYRAVCHGSTNSSKLDLKREKKISLLQEINFVFDDEEWEENFKKLQQCPRKNGRVIVPYKTNVPLGQWVKAQRLHYLRLKNGKSSVLDTDKALRLGQLGLHFQKSEIEHTTWETRLEQLNEFKIAHSHLRVSTNHPILGGFIDRLRADYKRYLKGEKSPLNEKKLQQLIDLGFELKLGRNHDKSTWKTWDEHFQGLLDFKEKHGHTRVPTSYDKDPKLASWVRQVSCNLRESLKFSQL